VNNLCDKDKGGNGLRVKLNILRKRMAGEKAEIRLEGDLT